MGKRCRFFGRDKSSVARLIIYCMERPTLRLGGRGPRAPLRPTTLSPQRDGDRAFVSRDRFRVGLFVPLSGSAGIWGPTCLACAELAVEEINRRGGLHDRAVSLVVADAGDEPDRVADVAADLIAAGAIDAIVGMHISAVRTALAETLSGQVPFIYTPLYEGGEQHRGVYCLGETPDEQLRPALAWLTANRRVRRWALIGNDYVWPRRSHTLARHYIAGLGGSVLADRYLPLGTEDFDPLLDRLAQSDADAVLLSLVGQDAVNFNRAFAARGLERRMVRLSMATDENMLLAIGPENTEGLYVAAGYFANLATDGNLAFIERYRARFGVRAPVLSALGQSIYEGFGLLDALDRDHFAPSRPLGYSTTRGSSYLDNGRKLTPVHLAEADGIEFRLLRNLAGTGLAQAN